MGAPDVSALTEFHDNHGATYGEDGSRRVVDHYGRPDRAHLAVRNGAGVMEHPFDIVIVSGEDRVAYVDNVVSNRVVSEPGNGCYALLLTPNGRIDLDLYVFTAPDRVLLFLPPGRAGELIEDWREKVFIQDVRIEDGTDEYTALGVYGPRATEKLASVLGDTAVPEETFSFVQATLDDAGVTVIPTEGLPGEESYMILCGSYDASAVMDTLINRGYAAVPFGRQTWDTLTLEAGTPLLADVVGELPNVVGIRNALDFEKGCFVGQEVVSRIENRGQPNQRLVGLRLEELPAGAASIVEDDETIGEIKRAAVSPVREDPIALGLVPFDWSSEMVNVETDADTIAGEITDLPFVDGSRDSDRLPQYPDRES